MVTKKPSWEIDVKNLSHNQIVELLKQLEGGGNEEIVHALRQELVSRVRQRGFQDSEIIRLLAQGVPRGLKLHQVAKHWAEYFGVSVEEFKRIASGT